MSIKIHSRLSPRTSLDHVDAPYFAGKHYSPDSTERSKISYRKTLPSYTVQLQININFLVDRRKKEKKKASFNLFASGMHRAMALGNINGQILAMLFGEASIFPGSDALALRFRELTFVCCEPK